MQLPMRRVSRAASLLALFLACTPAVQVGGHGDPDLEEHWIFTVAVSADGALAHSGLSSQPFELIVPPHAVELVWRIDATHKDNISFSVFDGEKMLARELKHESKSRIPKPARLTIRNVSGSATPFRVEIFAHTVHWHR